MYRDKGSAGFLIANYQYCIRLAVKETVVKHIVCRSALLFPDGDRMPIQKVNPVILYTHSVHLPIR